MPATKCNGKEQVVIVNTVVTVTIEVREIFNKFDSSLLKDSQIEVSSDALYFAASIQGLISPNERKCVAYLEATLFCPLRHTKRSPILNARESELRPRTNWFDVIEKVAKAKIQAIDCAGINRSHIAAKK